MLKLYHNDMSTCSQKVRFLLAEKGVEWEGVELDLRGGDQQRPDFLKINPKGLVPALDHDGNIVVESNIIIEYLNDVYPEPPLLPADPAGRATARWWMKKLDDGMHLEVAVLSFAIAFRHQLIKGPAVRMKPWRNILPASGTRISRRCRDRWCRTGLLHPVLSRPSSSMKNCCRK